MFGITELLASYISFNLNNKVLLIQIRHDCLILISQKYRAVSVSPRNISSSKEDFARGTYFS